MKLKDFKTGSYNDENLQNILKLFLKLESLNMFNYEMLTEFKKICMKAIQRQISELVAQEMPYSAKYTSTGKEHANHWQGIYKDNDITLDTKIFYSERLTFDCDNILSVENDGVNLLNVNCIISTQTQLKNIVDELLNIINED